MGLLGPYRLGVREHRLPPSLSRSGSPEPHSWYHVCARAPIASPLVREAGQYIQLIGCSTS
jgi:hypothetical protein